MLSSFFTMASHLPHSVHVAPGPGVFKFCGTCQSDPEPRSHGSSQLNAGLGAGILLHRLGSPRCILLVDLAHTQQQTGEKSSNKVAGFPTIGGTMAFQGPCGSRS